VTPTAADQPRRLCPHCMARPVPPGCATCTRSECQEASYNLNRERVAFARKRRSSR
jgi:hypothetical protein